ncbi:hypothetical protein AJ79_07297 [Helicocarpus griseus UAMH5409]|uniref:Uncharacterized protein n=1 Tax=Helicocarpus griseus UAMH5409 TaxID=1447875 RepID=A0A2B7X436_9EURO|nr:hypothetical protein AJ79_07297 [Helicocarpus griseus UAMH5409]
MSGARRKSGRETNNIEEDEYFTKQYKRLLQPIVALRASGLKNFFITSRGPGTVMIIGSAATAGNAAWKRW